MIRCDKKRKFRKLVRDVRDLLRDLQNHCEFPFNVLERELEEWQIPPPRPQALVSSTTSHPDIGFGALNLHWTNDHFPLKMPAGFDFKLSKDGQTDICEFRFDAHLYDPAAVRAFIERTLRLLDVVAADPDLTIAEAVERSRHPVA